MNIRRRVVILFLLLAACSREAGFRQETTLLAVGDVMLGRYIAKVMGAAGSELPFQQIAPALKAADIVFGNLESIISKDDTGPSFPDKPYNFHARDEAAPALRKAGFTILTLANNHAMDYGSASLVRTRALLAQNDIESFGAGKDLCEARRPSIIMKNGVRFGFLGYGMAHARSVYAEKNLPGIAPIRPEDIRKDIEALRSSVDVLVVSLHWGIEYDNKPQARQRVLAHKIIDWGADLIVGHHPHVMQGVEVYKGKIIAYSLGNFVFDQKGPGTDKSFMLACRFTGKTLTGAEIVPLDRFKRYFPKVAKGEERDRLLGDLRSLSRPLNADRYQLTRVGIVQTRD
jgi:poly-gamma-glutamate capsule biosynthesis protein CapA/YwtB (metallophosphatase superfamily)